MTTYLLWYVRYVRMYILLTNSNHTTAAQPAGRLERLSTMLHDHADQEHQNEKCERPVVVSLNILW